MKTMEQSEILAAYLIDSRQIDPLARRQALLACRGMNDTNRRDEAATILLLVLAALQKGTPRVDRGGMLYPLDSGVISLYADGYRMANGNAPDWLGALTGFRDRVTKQLASLFDKPDCFSPLSGSEPPDDSSEWPLLIISKEFVGFSRYWRSARKIEAYHLPERLKTATDLPDTDTVKVALQQVFALQSILPDKRQFHYRQTAAAALACMTRFLVLSGGPGTGKTSVVLQILRTLLRMYPHISADRIVICAPTGRAKARLGESIDAGLDGLQSRFPEFAETGDGTLRAMHRKTIHSLLGQRPDGSFKYSRDNRLPAQVIVVDEASMVDLNLFAALMEACSDECRLLLVGDMHQLPSVEAGAVLGDLTTVFSSHAANASLTPEIFRWIDTVIRDLPADGKDTAPGILLETPDWIRQAGALADHVIVLTHSYRSSQSILDLAVTVNRGDAHEAEKLLFADANDPSVSLDVTAGIEPVQRWLKKHLSTHTVAQAYAALQTVTDTSALSDTAIASVKTVLFTSTILTLAHEGLRGRKAINRLAGTILREKTGNPPGDRFFHGQPVILGTNHHDLDLYNGDIGVVLHTKSEGTRVCFPRGDHHHLVALDRLIDPEPAFALTVHKSQGSEFDNVLLVLPEKESPLLTRQIIYTGITRAKNQVAILGSREILDKAIEHREERTGGVRMDWPD
jgi:exodeoxyribonuclease V alpha subunit